MNHKGHKEHKEESRLFFVLFVVMSKPRLAVAAPFRAAARSAA